MKYKNATTFTHSQKDKVGILVTNLGTPDAPTTSALRRYLKEFLSDPRVIEVPRLIWWFALNVVILTIRPKRSAKAYKSIWTEKGSPLATHTKMQAEALRDRFVNTYGENIEVEWAMRYGNPSIASTLQKFQDKGVRKLLVLPLYPQYSGSTTASTFDAIAQDFCQRRWIPELRFINNYHDDERYIQALADSVRAHWATKKRADKLVFSFHGIPQSYLHNGDPYHCQCHKTSRLVATNLGLSKDEYLTTFQSRVGREEWLKPYTDETLKSLPEKGIKSVQVICPGFSSDCLETIEEIDEENREYFLSAGGNEYDYIPALNSQEAHIDALEGILKQHLQGWELETPETFSERASLAEAHTFNQR